MAEIKREFYKTVTFFRQHKHALHPNKTKLMFFSDSNIVLKNMELKICMHMNKPDSANTDLIFDIERISQNSNIQAIIFLGVLFEPNLEYTLLLYSAFQYRDLPQH
jgi:hypothetical protein